MPAGESTARVPRPKLGGYPYGGAGIFDCTVSGVVSLTFDDGPYIYTSDILDLLDSYDAKATFFITGNNMGKGQIDDPTLPWPALIRRMHAEGHQIASHTWTHQDLSALNSAQRKEQMIKNEMAIRNVLGFFPTYMRPPYSKCSKSCQADMKSLGYHITHFNLDTDDYNQNTPLRIQTSKKRFDDGLRGNRHLVISHDIHEQTVHNLTGYMLSKIQRAGYRAVTVGECLGDPEAHWYRSNPNGVMPPSGIPTVTEALAFRDPSCGSGKLSCFGSSS
ncbi:MAG: hypothetical protein M1813_003546 [Trichoglossum hirsutum]|nr:MAG: hypothetical protein M1813_003546 [Trichoglossum hirsutum]